MQIAQTKSTRDDCLVKKFKAVAERCGYSAWKLGNTFLEGRGCHQNSAQALEQYRRSADLGCALGSRSAGLLLSKGIGASPDPADAFKFFAKGAAAGDAECLFQVGYALHFGVGVSPNRQKAMEYFRAAALAGHSEAEAYYFYLNAVETNFPVISKQEVLARLLSEARSGNVAAHLAIGVFWESGFLGFTDYDKALSAYHYAAERGRPIAKFRLARMLFRGQGRQSTNEEIVGLFQSAADAGNAEALCALGSIYAYGNLGVQKDVAASRKYLEQAVSLGDPNAHYELASLLVQNEPTTTNLNRAADLLDRAHRLGCPQARDAWKILWTQFPDQFPKNSERVIAWMSESTSRGEGDAMLDFAMLHLYEDNHLDEDLGMFWLACAVDENLTHAHYALGYELLKRKKIADGLHFLNVASNQGCTRSAYTLGDFYFSQGKQQNKRLAVKYFRKSAEGGLVDAQRRLSQILFYGDGVRQNEDEAGYWMHLANKQDDKPGKPNLVLIHRDEEVQS